MSAASARPSDGSSGRSGSAGPASSPTTVAVFAGSPVVADGLAELLNRKLNLEVVGAASDIDAVTDLVRNHRVHVVVLGLFNHPEGEHRRLLDALHEATATTPGAWEPKTVCVIATERTTAADLISSGATAVLTTADAPSGLANAVAAARLGRGRGVSGSFSDAAESDARRRSVALNYNLTPRELEVLQGMVDGLRSKEIALRMGVSVNTVRTHVQHLLPKLGAHSRLKATALAIEEGLVSRPAQPPDADS